MILCLFWGDIKKSKIRRNSEIRKKLSRIKKLFNLDLNHHDDVRQNHHDDDRQNRHDDFR